jgi:hypothetical protein
VRAIEAETDGDGHWRELQAPAVKPLLIGEHNSPLDRDPADDWPEDAPTITSSTPKMNKLTRIDSQT